MSGVGERMKKERKKREWSMRHLGSLVGCAPGRISAIEHETVKIENVSGRILEGLAKAFGHTVDWVVTGKERYPELEEIEKKFGELVGQAYRVKESSPTHPGSQASSIPLVSPRFNGEWMEYDLNNALRESVPRPVELQGKRAFALKIAGDRICMYPLLKPDEIIYLDFDQKPNAGDIALITLHSGEDLIREISEETDKGYLLQCTNHSPVCRATIIKKSEIKHICKILFKRFL